MNYSKFIGALFTVSVLTSSLSSVMLQPAIAGCGFLDITCDPSKWDSPLPSGEPSTSEVGCPTCSSAISVNSIKDQNNAYYVKRIGEHSKWLFNHFGRADMWNQIELSARRDAGNTDSDYYRLRLAEHSKWFLNHVHRTDWWNQIELSARRDAKI